MRLDQDELKVIAEVNRERLANADNNQQPRNDEQHKSCIKHSLEPWRRPQIWHTLIARTRQRFFDSKGLRN